MSGLLWVAAMLMAVAVVSAGAWWVCQEGLRQGDEVDDAATSVALATSPDGSLTVTVAVTNPGPAPIVAAAAGRWAGRLPIAGVGRTTRRRAPAALAGSLVAVESDASQSVAWTMAAPTGCRRLVVDVHVWQQAGRLRRQRHVLAAYPRPAAEKPAWQPVP